MSTFRYFIVTYVEAWVPIIVPKEAGVTEISESLLRRIQHSLNDNKFFERMTPKECSAVTQD
jgi:hypothetical protein